WVAASAQALQFRMPSPPSRGIASGRSRGGASRSTCPAANSQLTPLATFTPQTLASRQKGEIDYWGLTVSQHPTLWFYIPYENGADYPASFVLQDDAENNIYQGKVSLPAKPGIVSVSLSAAPALEVGKSYRWFFKIYCTRSASDTPVYVQGSIQRVRLSSTLEQQMETASPQQQINLYAQNGIWFDALNTLANLRLANPQDQGLGADWSTLLQSVALEDLATAPLLKTAR
ncbi:MAG: DUF928 domain-containing protein, partial [Kovacikia sp.]